jgi:hypothetical protein
MIRCDETLRCLDTYSTALALSSPYSTSAWIYLSVISRISLGGRFQVVAKSFDLACAEFKLDEVCRDSRSYSMLGRAVLINSKAELVSKSRLCIRYAATIVALRPDCIKQMERGGDGSMLTDSSLAMHQNASPLAKLCLNEMNGW